jgi:DNA-binding MarR family transcriptional regulator
MEVISMIETKKLLCEQFMRLETLIQRYQSQIFSQAGSAMNPHKGQGRVLSLLKMQPEIGQKELGYLLDMSKQALAGVLVKLEKSGYITRTQSEKDKRSYDIKLTEAGREAAPDGDDRDSEYQVGAAFDCLSDEEQHTLSEYLARVITAFNELLGDDEDDYAEFVRERFFARHGFSEHGMPNFGRELNKRNGRGEFPGFAPRNFRGFEGSYDNDKW